MWNVARIGFMASEEMSFESVDDGRRMPAYTISSSMSPRLRWAKILLYCENNITLDKWLLQKNCLPFNDRLNTFVTFFWVQWSFAIRHKNKRSIFLTYQCILDQSLVSLLNGGPSVWDSPVKWIPINDGLPMTDFIYPHDQTLTNSHIFNLPLVVLNSL